MYMNVNIFVDMDGVLAKYNKNTYKYMYDKGFFLNRPIQKVMIDSIKLISEQYHNVYILSSIIDSQHCKLEKNLWLNKHLPEISNDKRLYVPYDMTKSEFVKNKVDLSNSINVLIDDFTKNLNEWTVPNAIPIKVLNGINNTKGSWLTNKGNYVSLENSTEEIVQYINRHIDIKQQMCLTI